MVHPQKRKLARSLFTCVSAELVVSLTALLAKGVTPADFKDILKENQLIFDDLKIKPSMCLQNEAKERVKLLQSLVEPAKIPEFISDVLAPPQTAPQLQPQNSAPPPVVPVDTAVPTSAATPAPILAAPIAQPPVPQGPITVEVVKKAAPAPLASKLHVQTSSENVAKGKQLAHAKEKADAFPKDQYIAASKIQAAYRGHRDRHAIETDKVRDNDYEFLSMRSDKLDIALPELRANVDKIHKDRIQSQKKNELEFSVALETERESIRLTDEPIFKQQVTTDFREWYTQHKHAKSIYPDLPPKEQFMDDKFTFLSLLKPVTPVAAPSGKDKGAKKGAAAKPAKGKKGDAGAVTAAVVELPPEFKRMEKVVKEYQLDWKTLEESDNFAQGHDLRVLRIILVREMKVRVKNDIYDVLAEELNNVKNPDAVKAAAPKKAGGKEKEGKAAGGGKGAGKVEDLTLLTPQDIQTLHVGLSKYGVLVKVTKPVDIPGFHKSYGPIEGNIWREGFTKWAQFGIEEIISHLFLVPLLTDGQSFEGYVRPMSGLFIGDFKIYDIVTYIAIHSSANIIDISPVNLLKAKAATGEDPIQVIAAAFKVARTTAPSVLVVRNPELIFAKKSPITEFDIKAYKKEFSKQAKLIKPNERVIIVGLSIDPSETDATAMATSFDFTYYVPPPTYGERVKIINDRSKGTISEISNILSSLSATNGTAPPRSLITDVTDQFMNNGKTTIAIEELVANADPFVKYLKNPNMEPWLTKLAPIAVPNVAEEAAPAKADAKKKGKK